MNHIFTRVSIRKYQDRPVEKDGFAEGTRIIVDTETGVQYLMWC